jgi:hypothetical protein
MRARLYKHNHDFSLITAKNKLYSIGGIKPYGSKFLGVVGANFVPCGILLTSIPNQLKHKFFELVKEC